MKMQMHGQSLRVRISEAELARLQDGKTVGNVTRMPGGVALRHEAKLVEGHAPALVATGAGFLLSLPRALLEPYVSRLPCRDGLVFRLPVEEGTELEVDFEVDVRDSVHSRIMPKRGVQSPVKGDRESS